MSGITAAQAALAAIGAETLTPKIDPTIDTSALTAATIAAALKLGNLPRFALNAVAAQRGITNPAGYDTKSGLVSALVGAGAADVVGGAGGGGGGAATAAAGAAGGGLLSKLLWGGGGALGLAGFGSLGSLAGLGPERLAMTGLGIAGSATGAAIGGGLLAAGAAGNFAVGAGSDAAVMTSTIKDTQTLQADYVALTQAVNDYGAGSAQADVAQRQLSNDMLNLGNTAGVTAELGLAKASAALNDLWDQTTSGARVQAVNILQQGIVAATEYVPLVAQAAEQNLSIINESIKPLFAWIQGPQGVQIFEQLEQQFQENIPTAVDALTNGFELALKTIQFASGNLGDFTQKLDDFLVKWNGVDFGLWESHMSNLIGLFRTWEAFIKILVKDIYDLFTNDAGTGTAIIQTLTTMLDKLNAWETSVEGRAELHNVFETHKQEVLELLQVLGPLLKILGDVELNAAPGVTLALTSVLKVIDPILQALASFKPTAFLLGIALILAKIGLLKPALSGVMNAFKSSAATTAVEGAAGAAGATEAAGGVAGAAGAAESVSTEGALLGAEGSLTAVKAPAIKTLAGAGIGATLGATVAGVTGAKGGAADAMIGGGAILGALPTMVPLVKSLGTFAADAGDKLVTLTDKAMTLGQKLLAPAANLLSFNSGASKTAAAGEEAAAGFDSAAAGAEAFDLVPVVAIIGGIVLAATLLITHWNEVKRVLEVVGNFLKAWWPEIFAPMTMGISLIVGAIVKNWSKIESVTKTIFGAIEKFIEGWWNLNVQIVTTAVGLVWKVIDGAWQLVDTTARAVWGGIEDFFKVWWTLSITYPTDAVNAIYTFLDGIWHTIDSDARAIWGGIEDFFKGLWTDLSNDFTAGVNAVYKVVDDMWHTIDTDARAVWGGIETFFVGLWTDISGAFTTGVNAVWKVLDDAWHTVDTDARNLWGGIEDFFKSVWTNISTGVSDAVGDIVGFFEGLPDKIKNAIGDALTMLLQVGKDIITGLENGLKDAIGGIGSVIGSIGSSIVGGFKSLLGISSPSKVFAEIGTNIGQGLIIGINGQQGAVNQASQALLKTGTPTIPTIGVPVAALPGGALAPGSKGPGVAAASTAPGSTTSTTHQEINVTMVGGPTDPYASARELAWMLKPYLAGARP
ncbi:MAG: phage tail protein [Acidimicrobiales bacterium]